MKSTDTLNIFKPFSFPSQRESLTMHTHTTDMLDRKSFLGYNWTNIYNNSRVNFSNFSGYRYLGIPHLKGNIVLGRLPHVLKEEGIFNNLIEAGELATQHPSGMCYYWLASKLVLLITKPEDIKVYKKLFSKKASTYLPVISELLGSAIVIDSGEIWKDKRNIYAHKVFTDTSLKKLELSFNEVVNKYISQIKQRNNDPVNLKVFFSDFAIETSLKTLFGIATIDDTIVPLIAQYIDKLEDNFIQMRAMFKWMLPSTVRNIMCLYNESDFESKKADLKKDFEDILNKIKNCGIEEGSLFAELSNYNIDGSFGDGTFTILGGTISTQATLLFALKLLAAHPEVEKKLRNEIKHLKDSEFTIEDISNIKYLDMVIKETLRLYPPVPMLIPREATEDYEINGIPVYKGDIVIVSPFVTQRSQQIWGEDAGDFKPERFNDDGINRDCAFLPFAVGVRDCIGKRFAMQEVKLMIAKLVLNFHIKMEHNDFTLTFDKGTLVVKYPCEAYFEPLSEPSFCNSNNSPKLRL